MRAKHEKLINLTMKIDKIGLVKKFSPQSAKNLFRRVLRQWEKSGKLPGKTNPTESIIKLNQHDNHTINFFRQFPASPGPGKFSVGGEGPAEGGERPYFGPLV
jgi:hypothetical protein